MIDDPVRVRFCPSPTGNPHVGMVRTALFNWAFARHAGGTFVFRIEDTDSARDTEASYEALLGSLRWLGLAWDEGPEVGGPYAPYRQSQRLGRYADVAARLRESGHAYDCYCSTEELERRREQAIAEKRAPGYDGHCRALAQGQVEAYRAAGRAPVLRLRMPDRDITWDDLVRGPITFAADQVPDYVLVRANGEPLYTLVNPVDDAAMRITHVLRGEDLLSSTPRQLALYVALAAAGVSDGTTPRFGHLPYVMGEGNKKLSKRDPESSLRWYRDEGYLPEALLNYLALLGWSMGEDREFFGKEEMSAAFTLERVSPNPARFDLKKCTAINGDWIRALGTDDLTARIVPFLARAGVVSEPPTEQQARVLAAAVPLVQERMETLAQSVGMLAFLLVPDEALERDAADAAAALTPDTRPVIEASIAALDGLVDWSAAAIEAALRGALIDGLGLKPKLAFGPVRVAVTGRRVSPPLFESLAILGRPSTLHRLRDSLG
ncbi:MAG: glutamate--tRNA ligase [Candidatus Nanopelagicales bacterium]